MKYNLFPQETTTLTNKAEVSQLQWNVIKTNLEVYKKNFWVSQNTMSY
jgi:hypothetical protein